MPIPKGSRLHGKTKAYSTTAVRKLADPLLFVPYLMYVRTFGSKLNEILANLKSFEHWRGTALCRPCGDDELVRDAICESGEKCDAHPGLQKPHILHLSPNLSSQACTKQYLFQCSKDYSSLSLLVFCISLLFRFCRGENRRRHVSRALSLPRR